MLGSEETLCSGFSPVKGRWAEVSGRVQSGCSERPLPLPPPGSQED